MNFLNGFEARNRNYVINFDDVCIFCDEHTHTHTAPTEWQTISIFIRSCCAAFVFTIFLFAISIVKIIAINMVCATTLPLFALTDSFRDEFNKAFVFRDLECNFYFCQQRIWNHKWRPDLWRSRMEKKLRNSSECENSIHFAPQKWFQTMF